MLTNPAVRVEMVRCAVGANKWEWVPKVIDDQGDEIPMSEIDYIVAVMKPEQATMANVRMKNGMLYANVAFCCRDEVIH
jgi:hypothetical protein